MKIISILFLIPLLINFGYCQEMKVPLQQMQPQQIQQIRRNFENDILVRMINDLEISDDQMPDFISRFREMSNVIRKQKEAKEKLMRELLPMLETENVAKNIEEKIAEFDKSSQQTNETVKKIRDDIRKILTPKQQIKLVVMMDDIIEQMLRQPMVAAPQVRPQPLQPLVPR
ncbi:MAG: hypothetical protein N2115_01710 [bacterium]|nr:hypothetical protein [bacterium]